MFQSSGFASLTERWRGKLGPRALALGLALLAEAVLLWLLFSLGQAGSSGREETVTVVNLEAQPPSPDVPEPSAEPEPAAAEAPAEPTPPVPATPPPQAVPAQEPQPAPSASPVLPLPSAPPVPAPAAPRPAPPAPAANGRVYGPPAPRAGSAGGDTARVGTAPNGQPLYAASWYREPGEAELRGYLSTATGPGWGLIACRTVADYRVEDCVGIDEYPQGSQILRAVLAAAWQFRVRPPRLGGIPQVGEWVRIRIDYEVRRRE